MWLEWSNDLSVGVASIDNQHKKLIKRVDQFLEAMKGGNGRQEILNTLNFLEEYVVVHFNDEEKYMKSINYAGLPEQHYQHEMFKIDVKSLKKEFEDNGAGLALLMTTQKKICDWLKNHILVFDKKIGKS